MPCRDDPVCIYCKNFECPGGKGCPAKPDTFNSAGALCDLLTLVEKKGFIKEVDKEILNWWKQHSKKEEDKIKREALAKLSDREKRALGLKK